MHEFLRGWCLSLQEGSIWAPQSAEEDLKHLVEMGCKVPHMSETHAKWWFGDEIPRHTVEIYSFYIDDHEVTNKQCREFVPDYFNKHLGFRYAKSIKK
jgi:formylglycine-generating enzyme required for sulfatase activity